MYYTNKFYSFFQKTQDKNSNEAVENDLSNTTAATTTTTITNGATNLVESTLSKMNGYKNQIKNLMNGSGLLKDNEEINPSSNNHNTKDKKEITSFMENNNDDYDIFNSSASTMKKLVSKTTEISAQFFDTVAEETLKKPSNGIKIYCAGPMFSIGDKMEMEQIAITLEREGFSTYLPHRDGLELSDILTDLPTFQKMKKLTQLEIEYLSFFVQTAIFCLDIYELLLVCDAVVMCLNGRVPDEGACCESALAFAAGKPIVQYKHDPRTKFFSKDNPILTGLFVGPKGGFEPVKELDALSGVVHSTMEYFKKINKDYDYKKNIPPIVDIYTKTGKAIKETRAKLFKQIEDIRVKVKGKPHSVALQMKMKPYMDFMTNLVITCMMNGIKTPDRFSGISMTQLAGMVMR